MDQQLESMIEPVVTALECELWGIERLVQGKYSVLKVYIDAEEGVDVDDCARVSRQISSMLDVEEPFSGKYTLEVSSPGMDRRLFRLEQFEKYKGARVRLQLRQPYDGKRKYKGLLCGIEDDEVILRIDEEEVLFPYESIEKANVIPDY